MRLNLNLKNQASSFLKNPHKVIEGAFLVLLLLIGFFSRMLPHPPNFVPILAIAIFSGRKLRRRYSILVPLSIMFISDVFIGFYEPIIMASVYLSFVSSWLIGRMMRREKAGEIFFASLKGAFLFFVVTNFSVWAFSPWYSKDVFGLVKCFYLALPFFRNTLISTVLYTPLLFLIYNFVESHLIVKIPEKFLWKKLYSK